MKVVNSKPLDECTIPEIKEVLERLQSLVVSEAPSDVIGVSIILFNKYTIHTTHRGMSRAMQLSILRHIVRELENGEGVDL